MEVVLLDKGCGGIRQVFSFSKLPKDEFEHLLMIEKKYGYFTLFFHIDDCKINSYKDGRD